MDRRSFLGVAGLGLTGAAFAGPAAPVPLGIDLFSIRDSGYSPTEFLDYAAKQGAKVVHFSEIRFIGSLDDANLRSVRAHAEQLGIQIEIGMRSICPTSSAFDSSQGTAQQQLERMIHAATVVGSPIVRAFLGTSRDRSGPVPIEAHIENAAKVLRSVRGKVLDNNLKVAIENHAGDMQARELKTLIEESGKDFVGACLDSGNPLWAIEDPHLTLETLAPHVLTSHVRDTAVWRIDDGAAVAWTRMGEGNVGIADWIRKYATLCPGRALSLEIIVTGAIKYPYFKPDFWNAYRNTPAREFARFVALADKGTPRPDPPAIPKDQQAQRQREDLETSMAWTKQLLGVA